MSLSPDFDLNGEQCCDQCHLKEFSSQYEFKLRSLENKTEPTIPLARLRSFSPEKNKQKNYKINNRVTRRAKNHVSPLKISFKKHKGKVIFKIVNKQKKNDNITGTTNRRCAREKVKRDKILKPRTQSSANVEVNIRKKEVEGDNLLKRVCANLSVTRKGGTLPVLQIRKETENELVDKDCVNKELSHKNEEKVLERLLNNGISGAKQNNISSKGDSSDKDITFPTGVNVFSSASAEDVKKASDSSAENESQKADRNSNWKKPSGLTLTLCSNNCNRGDSDGKSTANDSAEKENKVVKSHGTKGSDLEIFIQNKSVSGNVSSGDIGEKNSHNDSLSVKEVFCERRSTNEASRSTRVRTKGVVDSKINLNDNEVKVPKKHVRVKNSSGSKKTIEKERKESAKEREPAKGLETVEPKLKFSSNRRDSSVDRPGRIREQLGGRCVVVESPLEQEGNGKEPGPKMGVNSSPTEQVHSEYTGSREDCASPATTHDEPQDGHAEEVDRVVLDQRDCRILSPEQQNENVSSTFNGVSCDDGSFSEGNNEAEEQSDEVTVAYSSLPNEDQSLDQHQEDPLSGSASSNGETINQNFLQNFLNEAQPSQSDIQPDSSEYMSLERLGQVSGLESQHGQANYDVNSSDASTPMEQLSQQVQRLPNPPQINVIPQHHMQAPPPPQLHAAIQPMSNQQSNSFDALNHVQPPMPPPLYQGYNVYNQNFSSQGPQPLPPRPPILQQRPQIQPRTFQGMATPPRPRNRSYPMKRNTSRMNASQDVPHKQRRMETSAPARNQAPNLSPTTKIPSGITVTPTKKNLEASKVANVLASRGITVTPSHAAPRQQPPANRSQQRSNPVLNIGPGVSITPNNGSKSGGSFAVPGSRRNNPIVNADVERPERCATVDLTLDDDPPVSAQSNRLSVVRFPCSQCSKVFPTSVALENHKASHRTAGALPFKCDKCTAQYPNASGLQQHKAAFHKAKHSAPELAIPIVDLNHPGAREQLAKCGVHGFLPLSQLQSNSLGYFGVPIIHLDSNKEKAVSNLSSLGAANVLVLGKMRTLSQPQIR